MIIGLWCYGSLWSGTSLFIQIQMSILCFHSSALWSLSQVHRGSLVYFIAREWTWCWVSTLHLLPPSSKSPLNCFYRSGCCSTETKCFKKDQQQIASSRCEITQIYNRKVFKNKYCYASMNLIVWLKLTFSMIIYGPLCDQADLHLNDLNKKVSMKYFFLLQFSHKDRICYQLQKTPEEEKKLVKLGRQIVSFRVLTRFLRTCKTETGIEINLGKSISSVLLTRTAANISIKWRC